MFYQSAAGACLDLFHREGVKCYWKIPDKSFSLLPVLVIGLLNNIISHAVFAQSKFNAGLPSWLLRVLHTNNIAASLLLLAQFSLQYTQLEDDQLLYHMARGSLMFLSQTTLHLSQGILTFMAVLRCVIVKYPRFVMFSKAAYPFTFLVILTILVASVRLHSAFYQPHSELVTSGEMTLRVAYYSFNIVLNTLCNTTWVLVERDRLVKSSEPDVTKEFLIQLTVEIFRFSVLASGLFVSTTLPVTLFYLIPRLTGTRVSCGDCTERIIWLEKLKSLAFATCLFDNFVYLRSRHYRQNLAAAFHRVIVFEMARLENMDMKSEMPSNTEGSSFLDM